mmetsp:Transcript_6637/g.15791  ORF Transcript_6637/g.15791 Transcript_6637/m.15791 type:complete len:184 (-) Transcript_6637:1239-1790(-)
MRRVLTGLDFSAHHTDMNTCLSPPITTIITITKWPKRGRRPVSQQERFNPRTPRTDGAPALSSHKSTSNPSTLKDFASFWRVKESEVDTIQKRVDRLREFVNDPRLKHWYIQNYDMVGCGPYADPAFSPNETASQKVSPLPTLFGKSVRVVVVRQFTVAVSLTLLCRPQHGCTARTTIFFRTA